uniref:Capsid protein n=1 Tax=Cressdnaviricota sp. TaxID=2748378 RepID=A0A8F3E5K8_9VIRU|nr:MAG: capsid protein [Cressdnaviricota sp.]
MRSRYARKRSYRRKPSRRPARRVSRVKKRAYRKKTSRPTRRSMINTMSRKKRDTTLSLSGTGNNPAPTATLTIGPLRLLPTTTSSYHTGTHAFLYCPTYRWLQPNNAEYIAQRTSSRPFMKGFSESFEFSTNDGSTWLHRRIAFTTKDPQLVPLLIQSSIGAQATAVSGTNRPFRDMAGEATGNYQTAVTNVYDRIFQGIDTVDWANVMTAKLDRTRITPLYDSHRRMASGNNAGTTRVHKHYVPLNKTLVYDDEENGTTMSPAALSTEAKPGMGNLYILDLFECDQPVDPAGSVLQFQTSSTLYWHEK